jgi:tetratricopeptide (TPR) repeat protein
MELVRGIPVTQYCDERRLSTRDRLELFVSVCQAIQHAHTKGIIHRDIKPSNVLVTLHDDVPVPKVIDFGIAKATSHRLTEKTLFTEFRQFIGTPEYMSPDQAEISGLDVDTRTDIYSLGVLLYELLTGTTPFDSQTLRTGGHAEIQRIIREVEPPVPSTRVSALAAPASRRAAAKGSAGSSAVEIAHLRRLEPGALRRLLRGELDWIVMKAMEKDRTRRYQTAHDLVEDIRRLLANQPIQAGPPGARYRLRKFVRRHRVGVTAGALMALAITCGLLISMIGFIEANREAKHSQAVSVFLQSLIEVQSRAEDSGEFSVDQIIVRSRELFGDDHAVVGSLLMSRAGSLATAGRLEEAIDAQQEALGFYRRAHPGDHPSVAAALAALAKLQEDRNDLTQAESTYRDALAMTERLYGPKSRLTAELLDGLTALLVTTRNQTRDEEIRGLWPKVIESYREALGPDHRTTVTQLCNYGTWLHQKNYSEGLGPILEEAVERARRVLGPGDATTFVAINSLAQYLLFNHSDLERTLPLVVELIEMSDGLWGACHATAASLRAQLVFLYDQSGDREASIRTFEDFLETRREGTLTPNLALVGAEQQAWVAAETWIDDYPESGREYMLHVVNDVQTALRPESDPSLAITGNAVEWLRDHDFLADAEVLAVELVELLRQRDDKPDALASNLIRLGDILVLRGRPSEGESALRECLAIREANLEPGDWLIASARLGLGHTLAAQDRFEEAEPLLLTSYEELQAKTQTPRSRLEKAREFLADLYERWGRPEEAARWHGETATPP